MWGGEETARAELKLGQGGTVSQPGEPGTVSGAEAMI